MRFEDFAKNEIENLKKRFLYRERKVLDEDITDFSSNDYLGLKDCKETKEKLKKFLDRLSLGSGASPFISGYHNIQRELEEYLAKFKNSESCFVVGSGYLANVGVMSALATEQDTIFSDELNHGSIIDGVRLSKAKRYIYKHRDLNNLEDLLKKDKGRFKFIITDAVFSMEGDIADLRELKYLADKYGALLVIDDAHGTGVLGDGYGSLAYFNIEPDENIIQIGTLSKAVGSYGAFICSTENITKFLINKVRTGIFSTALSPIQNFISLENLKIIENEKIRIKKLYENINYLVNGLKNVGIDINYYGTPIITYILKDEKKALDLRDYLYKNKIFIQAIRPPTVPEGTARLRITVSYKHSNEDIDRLINLLKEYRKNL